MNIGIDGYEANTEKRVGIGQYAYQLLRQLQSADKNNCYTVFLPQPPLTDMSSETSRWRYVVGKPGSLWTIFQLPQLISGVKLDLFFSPTHYAPWFTKLPQVLSVMDLSYLHYPEMFRTKDLLQLKYMGAISIKRAKKILTISNFSRKEIIEHYNYPEEDVIVTYPGLTNFKSSSWREPKRPIGSSISSGDDIASLQHDKSGKYILFVGTIQPRKNIIRLVEAFELLDQGKIKLVIVGKKGWLYEPILEKIRSSPKREAIKILDYVPDTELPTLYQNAVCLVLPSLYEGFGIPVVEALSSGCPVVVSNTTSLPEVAGEAGIYVDPLKVTDIARGLKKAVQLKGEERERLIKKGKEQVKKFIWESGAKKTIEVFESINT